MMADILFWSKDSGMLSLNCERNSQQVRYTSLYILLARSICEKDAIVSL